MKNKLTKGPMADTIIPVILRPDVTVYIQGIPYDLTPQEAKKLINIISALQDPVYIRSAKGER